MHLSIKNEPTTVDEVEYPYTAGESRTHKLYGFGDFEVRMKPSNEVGTVSTFFTYTDEWNIVNGEANTHDEIDIEFLGKDTTKVQFNYFVNGVGNHEYMYDLGFDASQAFHNYGFRWSADSITWLVDGKVAYQVTKSADNPLPTQAGRILSSYWPSSLEGWSGAFSGSTTKTCDYEWFKASAEGFYADGEEPVPVVVPDEGVNWNEIEDSHASFSTARKDIYTVNESGGDAIVTYEEAGQWATVVAGGVAEEANVNNLARVPLKNDSKSKAIIRVDVQGTTKSGNTDCLNTAAYAKDHDEIYTDTNWGGSKIELAAGEEVILLVTYDVTTELRGAATCMLFFIDSLQDSLVAHEGGNVTIGRIKFANTTGAEIVPYTPAAPDPTDKEVALTFSGGEGSYTLDPKDQSTKSVNVSYEGLAGNSYANFGAGLPFEAVSGKGSVALTIKNNGSAAVRIRIDVKATDDSALNTSALAQGHDADIYTDLEWGGSYITVNVDEQVVFTVNFSQAEKNATYLMFFIDSARGDAATYNGNVTLSGFVFGEGPKEGLALEFTGNEEYVLDPASGAAKSVNVKYENIAGNSYKNFGAGLAPEAVANKGSLNVTIKNNGIAPAKVRVDIQGETQVGNTKDINTNAYAEGHSDIWTDKEWGGSVIEVAPNEEVVFTVEFDQSTERGAAQYLMFFLDSARGDAELYSGDVTLSNFIFNDVEVQPEGMYVVFNASEGYTLDSAGSDAVQSVNVSYTAMKGNSYAIVGAGCDPAFFEGKNTFKVTMQNNGVADVRVRVDVQGTTQVGNHKVLNTNATAPGHNEIFTETEWGGSYIVLAAGEKVTLTVTFDQTTERGAATYFMFFIDSAWGDSEERAGDVTLSDLILA